MSNTTILIIAGAVILVIFFLIAKLAIRWAIRVTIVGVILVALLGTGGFWWWTNRLAPKPKPTPTRQPSSAPGKRSTVQ
jgi:energy-coupling factor transporter transmembrane protein EcfT